MGEPKKSVKGSQFHISPLFNAIKLQQCVRACIYFETQSVLMEFIIKTNNIEDFFHLWCARRYTLRTYNNNGDIQVE